MEEIFNFITKEQYDNEVKQLKSGESKVILNNENVKIKIKKAGKKVYKFIYNYGNKSFEDCIRNLALIQS